MSSLDKLFAFGIDPVDGGLAVRYARRLAKCGPGASITIGVLRARTWIAPCARSDESSDDLDSTLLNVAIEHRLMHAETLAYLLHNLPFEKKLPQRVQPAPPRPAPAQRAISIPAGLATLGQSRPHADSFGWDNEFEALEVARAGFHSGCVSDHQRRVFEVRAVRAATQDERCWSAEDWEWRRSQSPRSSALLDSALAFADRLRAADWEYRAMFAAIPLPLSWPVYVSHAEASAFARWASKKLPTEAQWHRAAYGTPQGAERRYPWGDAAPDAYARKFSSCAMGSHRRGRASGGRERFRRDGSARQWMGMDLDAIRAAARFQAILRFIPATPRIFSTASIS